MSEMVQATGRRKNAVARVMLRPGNGQFKINGRTMEDFFPSLTHQALVKEAFALADVEGQFDLHANVNGGGITGQAEAIRHGVGRALVRIDDEHRLALKPHKVLTRDPRMVERKKSGRKKARKNFQFSKR